MPVPGQLYKKPSQIPVWEVVVKLSILAGFGIAASTCFLLIAEGLLAMLL